MHDSLAAVAGVDIVYSRNGQAVELRAIQGRIDEEEFGLEQASLQANLWAFIVKRDELVLVRNRIIPRLRDTIEVTKNGETTVYEVTDRLGERCYRWVDQFQTLVRIFTVET